MTSVDTVVNEIKTHLDEKMGRIAEENLQKMKDLTEQQAEQIKAEGQTRSELEKRIEKSDEEFRKLSEELAGVKGEMEGYRKAAGRMGGGERVQSPGEMFTGSEGYREQAEQRSFDPRRVGPVEVGSFFQKAYGLTSVEGTEYGSLGNFINPQQLGYRFNPPEPEITVIDRIPVIPTSTTSVEYIQKTGFANLYAELTANAAALATTLAVPSTGFYVGQRISVDGQERVVATVPDKVSITITSGLTNAVAAGRPVTSAELGFTAHGELKPQANIKFRERSHVLGTIAHWMSAHKQTLSDVPQMRALIDQEMRFGIRLALEAQIVYGNGQTPNISGIMNDPNIQSLPAATGSAATVNIDHIRKMATKARRAQRPVDTVLLTPEAWEQIELAKGTDGHYIQVNITNGRQQELWRLSVIDSLVMRGNDVLVGGFGYGAYYLDREDTQLLFSDQHADFFARNMVAILAEARGGLAITLPEAFVKSSLVAS